MTSQDEFKYFPADTKDPIGKYTQPKVYASVVVGEEPAKETMRKANVSWLRVFATDTLALRIVSLAGSSPTTTDA